MDTDETPGSREDRTPPLSGVRWVAFDAVGTLMSPYPDVGSLYAEVGARFGSRIAADEAQRRFRRYFAESPVGRRLPAAGWNHCDSASLLQTSESREREWWLELVGRVLDDVQDVEGCFEELFARFGRAETWRCHAGVEDVLTRLKQRGYQLAVASNFDHRLHAVCDGLRELAPLSLRVISTEVGWRKPARAFYESLISATGCHPQQVLMTGDDLDNDVLGPLAVGMPAVWLRRAAGEQADTETDVVAAATSATEREQPAPRRLPAVSSISELLDLLPGPAPENGAHRRISQ